MDILLQFGLQIVTWGQRYNLGFRWSHNPFRFNLGSKWAGGWIAHSTCKHGRGRLERVQHM